MTPDATAQAEQATAAAQAPDAPVTVRPVAFSPLDGAPAPAADAAPRSLDLLLDVRVPITVELGHTVMPIEELLALRAGSVLELDKLAGEPVALLIRGHAIAHGEIIVVDDTLGLRITRILDPAERVRPLGAAAQDGGQPDHAQEGSSGEEASDGEQETPAGS